MPVVFAEKLASAVGNGGALRLWLFWSSGSYRKFSFDLGNKTL
jgi:hypothetical protein